MQGWAVGCQESLVEVTLGKIAVGIDPAISKKGPVGTTGADLGEIAFRDQDFLIGASLDQQAATRIGHEAATPELQSTLWISLMTDSVHGAYVETVGDGVASLDGFPGGLLLRPMLLLLLGQPTDRGRVKEYFGPAHGGEASSFRVPLIPADQHTHPAEAGVP